MTPNELAFLALGLVLGIASGAAIVVVAGSRPPKHEIRLTVARDAIPRRASTLAADTLVGGLDGPAPGGPGDRRAIDRDVPEVRTIVRSPLMDPAPMTAPTTASLAPRPAAVAIAIEPEADPLLAELAGPVGAPSLRLVLEGDHRAMLALLDAVAPSDEQHHAWEELLASFVEAARARAVELGLVDLPMGNPFWDAFTIDECREVVVALAATGRTFDGRDGWADGRVPAYRDLSQALAACGIDPRRIRSWPNSAEIADLFRGARVAAGEAVERHAPTLDAADLRRFLGGRDAGLEPLWSVWDAVRSAVAGPGDTTSAEPAAEAAPPND